MRKKKEKEIWYGCFGSLEDKDPFKKAWCPLFGCIPFVDDIDKHPIVKRCIEIIIKACEQWGVPSA
jgi:hypothetical protein